MKQLDLEIRGMRKRHGDEGCDGGLLEGRAQRIHVWNTRPRNMGSETETWNEFLAA
jgi:putative spermidine/putrescine transport system substrate-binding protein